MSRSLDGDLTGPPASASRGRMDDHLAVCPACTRWRERAAFLHRTVAAASLEPPPGLIGTMQLAVRAAARRRNRTVLTIRAALGAVALLGIALALPALALGSDDGIELHASHEIGSIEVALCAGLLAAVAWPHRARGVLTVLASAAGLLLITAGSDIAAGYTTVRHEADHGVVVAGALLLWWLSRLVPETAPPHETTDGLDLDARDADDDAGDGTAAVRGTAVGAPPHGDQLRRIA